MKLIGKLAAAFDHLNNALAMLAAALIVFMMIAIGTEVAMRFFLDRTTTWVLEITQYCLLFITFLGAAWLLRREGHVKMDLLLNRLSPMAQARLNVVTSFVCAFVCLIIVYYGARVTWDYYSLGYYYSTPLETPKFLVLGIIPVGTFLLFIQFLRRGRGYLRRWRESPGEEQ